MNLITRLPITAPTTIGVVNSSDVISYSEYLEMISSEVGAYEYWNFNKGLVGSNNKSLVPQNASEYVLSNGIAKLKTNNGGGLVSDKSGSSSHTICMVVKVKPGYTGTAITKLAGSLVGTSGQSMIGFDPANGGVNGYVVGGGFGTAPRLQHTLDQWQFIAVSFPTGASPVINTITGDAIHGIQESSKTSLVALSNTNNIALGNAYYGGAGYITAEIECAEFIIFDSVKTVTEMKEIYGRSKQRMKLKMINI